MILFWINVFVNIFDMTTYTVGVRSSFPHEQRKHGRTPDSLIMSTNQNTKRTGNVLLRLLSFLNLFLSFSLAFTA